MDRANRVACGCSMVCPCCLGHAGGSVDGDRRRFGYRRRREMVDNFVVAPH